VYLTGVTKSGAIKECREALEELYECLLAHNIGNPNAIHSIVDKFTEAGLMDQVKINKNELYIHTNFLFIFCFFVVLFILAKKSIIIL
jgi:hypothetical protein